MADFSHARDAMKPFLASDDPDNSIDGQTVAVSKLQIGAELEIPVETARGDLRFRRGLRFVAFDASGGAFAGEVGGVSDLRSRGWIDYRLDDGLVLDFDGFARRERLARNLDQCLQTVKIHLFSPG